MSKTILIAVTDPNIVYLLQRYAKESGFQAVRSSSAEELLQLAQEVQPDLIFDHDADRIIWNALAPSPAMPEI